MEIAAQGHRIFVSLVGASLLIAGCESTAPPPARVPTDNNSGLTRTHPQPKPIYVAPTHGDIPLPIDDPPLVTQAPPEQTQFIEAYEQVGRPRIVVFVNRTIEGNIISTIEYSSVSSVGGQDGQPSSETSATSTVYLAPGTYDETKARAIDYEAIELVMGDLLAANGRVKLISPSMARTKLTDAQIKQMQGGEPMALRTVAETLGTDVLIQVQARPTQQTKAGLGVRVLAEAIDVADGRSLARAFVDVPPPLTKTTLQKYSRYLTRKLMYNLAGAWRFRPNEAQMNSQVTPPNDRNSPPVPDPTGKPKTPQPIPTPPPTPKDAPTPPPAPDQPPTPKN